jgi:hypothetical protein
MLLYERLRRAPSASTVPGSLPVLFFGDLFSARVVTAGLNPSNQEYTTRDGAMLTGRRQRFATLATLGARDRQALSDAQADEAIEWMRAYFQPGQPVYSWFAGLGRVVSGFDASLADGSAAHLDLIQEATKPTWSALPDGEREALLRADLPFLEWLIRGFPLEVVICDGATVGRWVRHRLGVEVAESGEVGLIKWWAGKADVDGRRVGFAGWNRPLIRPTGLKRSDQVELGCMLRTTLDGTH